MDVSAFECDYYDTISVPLSESQRMQIANATMFYSYHNDIIVKLDLAYTDGATLSATYVKDSYRDRLTAMLEDELGNATVEFWFDTRTPTVAPIKDFKGIPMILKGDILDYGDNFTVYGIRDDLDLRCHLGVVIVEGGKFYYADFKENGLPSPRDGFDIWPYSTLKGYEITDPALLESLKNNTEAYYSDGVGALYDDDFTEDMSIGVLVLLFGILPGFVLILAVVLLIRNKGYQRKTWAVTAGIAASELAVFGVLVGIFTELIGK
jgi:hypothetical protein